MHHSQTTASLFVAILSATVLVGCQQPSTSDVDQTEEGVVRLGTVEAVDTVSRAVAPKDRPLVIEGGRGTVVLAGADQESVELEFIRRGRGETTEDARDVLEDVTIEESGTEQTYTFSLETNAPAYAAVDVRGTVPRDAELRINRSMGPIAVTGVKGPITVSHEHGPVRVREAGAPVEIETKNGDVEVGLWSVPAGATVKARTVNGDVSSYFPPNASLEVSAETSVGVIRTKGLSWTDQQFMPRDAGGKYTAQLGAGSATVNLRTKNGSILIQAADTTTQTSPQPDTLSVPPSDTTVTMPASRDTAEAERDTASQMPPVDRDTAGTPGS